MSAIPAPLSRSSSAFPLIWRSSGWSLRASSCWPICCLLGGKNMYPVLFKFGPFAIHAYGFFIALAFLAGILVSLYYAKREGIGSQTIFDLAIYVIISGLVGARLSYVFGQWEYFRGNPAEIFMAQKGGLVFLGGFLLALLVTVVYVKVKNMPRLKLFDALAPGVALGCGAAPPPRVLY